MKLALAASCLIFSLGSLALPLAAQEPEQLTPFTSGDPMQPSAVGVTAVGSQVFFSTSTANVASPNAGLWASDGSAAGTARFRAGVFVELTAPAAVFGDVDLSPIVVDGIVYFVGYNGQFDGVRGIWRSDLTPGGTFEIARFVTSDGAPVNIWPSRLVPVGSNFYFVIQQQVWRSGGTTATTELMHDFGPASMANPGSLAALGNSLIFSTSSAMIGPQAGIWKSDGTPATTSLVKPLAFMETGGFADPSEDAQSRRPAASAGLLYFRGFEGAGATTAAGLWRTDGTLSGTFEVGRFEQFAIVTPPRDLTPFAGQIMFVVGQQVWRAGSLAGSSELVFDLASLGGPNTARPSALTSVGGAVLFSVGDSATPGAVGLWQTAGTPGSTARFSSRVRIDLSQNAAPPNVTGRKRPLVVGSNAFFSGTDPSQPVPGGNAALWQTDLTRRGTFDLAQFSDPFFPSGAAVPDSFAYIGSTLVCRAAGNLFALRPQVCQSDFNGDGEVNADDLADFINIYFTPCP